jgi:predicted Zn-dependent protease
MNRRSLLTRVLPIGIAIVIVAMQFFSAEKFTNDAGRQARVALDPKQEQALGLQSYAQVLQQSQVISSGPEYEMVRKVAGRLAAATGKTGSDFEWAVSLVRDEQVNAFCLPGGKIVVYTGILPVAQSEAGLATVMGHEMAHATLRHGSERLFKQKAAQTLQTGVAFSVGDLSYEQQRMILGAFGAGAQYGYLMPFGRDHEKEADAIGLTYMARAGYDPREAIGFWQRMAEASGRGAPPEFLSTHPSHGTRIEQLKELMPGAMAEFEKTRGR